MLKRYILYGLSGWCAEVIWTGLGSLVFKGDLTLQSSTSIWMFFIYGLAVLLEPVYRRIKDEPALMRGGIYCILIYCIEYSTGLFLKVIVGASPWLYTNDKLAVNGLITLRFIPVWFVAGLLFERLYLALLRYGFTDKYQIGSAKWRKSS